MKDNPKYREAYVEAEVLTSIAHQVRSIRISREWSQAHLAKQLGTTQTAVSRIEDPSYGKLSVSTLLSLSKAFDVGLNVEFVSMAAMLRDTFHPKMDKRTIPSFEQECESVEFIEDSELRSFALNFDFSDYEMASSLPKLLSDFSGCFNEAKPKKKPTSQNYELL